MKIRWIDSPDVSEKMVPPWVARLLNEKLKEFWCGPRFLKGAERDAAIAEFKATLRGLVDQWIDSGRVNKEVTGDAPSKRSITWRSRLYPTALIKTLMKFWERNPARGIVELDGSSILEVGPKSTSAGLQDSLHIAREFAVFEFVRLLDSLSSRQRLFRCDGCNRYFARERTPQRAIYHGSFCETCAGRGGTRRTVESRNRRTQEMVGWAADAWTKWKPERRFGERAVWIAKQITARLPSGESIKRNWVTRHQTEIETEVERRNHAKG